jgi:hypothetical protein
LTEVEVEVPYREEDADRRQEINAKIETRTAQGQWGLTERDLLSRQSNTRTRVSILALISWRRVNSATEKEYKPSTASL